jgi:hypothetical protein
MSLITTVIYNRSRYIIHEADQQQTFELLWYHIPVAIRVQGITSVAATGFSPVCQRHTLLVALASRPTFFLVRTVPFIFVIEQNR